MLEAELDTAVKAAHAAGELLVRNFHRDLSVDEKQQYDIKLALDRESQELIFQILGEAFPEHGLIGEEGDGANPDAPWRWIVDPIDGTVNYFYGVPHWCISIALMHEGESQLGVIFDPMMKELWTVVRGGETLLNGAPVRCSERQELSEAMVVVGFSKSEKSLEVGLKKYGDLVYRVRKTRLMGSAALALAYIASGRLDGYLEEQISLWDIAAGQLMVEASGGKVDVHPSAHTKDKLTLAATNGKILF